MIKRYLTGLLYLLFLVGCGPSPVPARPEITASNFKEEAATRWWDGRVFYEIFVRSFYDSRNGPLADDGIGDIQGLIDKLDYLNDGDPDTDTDLNIGGIWLMPVSESVSYHGYDVVDYYSIHEDFGTLEDFKRLIKEAHKRDIKIIVDLVMNHSSNKHPWFENAIASDSPYHDWYLWTHKKKYYGGPWGQTVWHNLPWWQKGRHFFEYYGYYGLFTPKMPDLNFENPAVTEAMYHITKFWLSEVGVDGFRLDAIRHLIEDSSNQEDTEATHQWLRDYFKFYKSINPNAMTVGEVWAESEILATYVPNQMDLNFQFDVAEAIIKSINFSDAQRIIDAYSAADRIFKDNQYATFITNHDQIRTMSQFDKEMTKARLGATVLLTSPGVPFIYYGEEIGLTGFKPDPNIRTPMHWDASEYAGFSTDSPWKDPKLNYEEVNVKIQQNDENSLLNHYKRLIKMRINDPVLHAGDFKIIPTGNNTVYAFLRSYKNEHLLMLINLHSRPHADYQLSLEDYSVAGNKDLLINEPLNNDIRKPVGRLEKYSAYMIPITPQINPVSSTTE